MVKRHKGFQYAPERPQAADFMHQKWGWRATRPGEKRACNKLAHLQLRAEDRACEPA